MLLDVNAYATVFCFSKARWGATEAAYYLEPHHMNIMMHISKSKGAFRSSTGEDGTTPSGGV